MCNRNLNHTGGVTHEFDNSDLEYPPLTYNRSQVLSLSNSPYLWLSHSFTLILSLLLPRSIYLSQSLRTSSYHIPSFLSFNLSISHTIFLSLSLFLSTYLYPQHRVPDSHPPTLPVDITSHLSMSGTIV